VAPFGAVLLIMVPVLVVVGVSGPAPAPSLSAPGVGLDASATLPAPTCGALGVLSSLVGTCPGDTAPTSAAAEAAKTTRCSYLQKLLKECNSGGADWLLLELALIETLHLTWPTLPTTTTTTTSPSTTTTSTSTTTTSTSTTTTTTQPATSCVDSTPPLPPPSGSWACTFDDEFNGTQLDTSKWSPQLTATSGYTAGIPPHEVCYVDNPNTISESGGYLSLSIFHVGLPRSCQGINGVSFVSAYEGGMVTSHQIFSQEYGYFQARAELPASTARGLQETLWLYPENETLYGPWPDSGEIDYGEFYSSQPSADFPVLHYPGSTNDPNASTTAGCNVAGASPTGQFNTYALSWTPTTITAYFNGVPCITDVYAPYVTSPDTAPEPFNQPFFLAFTSALGVGTDSPSSSIPDKATTKLDWVRVWQYG
jgi:beta-glucanase (GH16 family)